MEESSLECALVQRFFDRDEDVLADVEYSDLS
jgi:hypothetical protein